MDVVRYKEHTTLREAFSSGVDSVVSGELPDGAARKRSARYPVASIGIHGSVNESVTHGCRGVSPNPACG